MVGLIQSRTWLAGIGAVFIMASVLTAVYARRQGVVIRSAKIEIEGRSLDCLNIANLRRLETGSLTVQAACHTATIDGEDLTVAWRYSGYCRATQETALGFSVDSDSTVPFYQLECFGHDLLADPKRTHKIRPLLVGPDGLSKKIMLPFLMPLTRHQPFDVLLQCRLPQCIKPGVDYFTSTLSFAQEKIPRSAVHLVFVGSPPEWVRVYECASGVAVLLRDLKPTNDDGTVFVDIEQGGTLPSMRVFAFSRIPRSL